MIFVEITLVVSALFCSLVAGFLFAYAIVIMPGIHQLGDREFIRTFQVTDRVIQNNHPVFIAVWVGSVIALLVCVLFGYGRLPVIDFALLAFALLGYLGGVQVPTIAVNLPLNRKLQAIDVGNLNATELKQARVAFESTWNRSNAFRTIVASVVSLLLMVLAVRL